MEKAPILVIMAAGMGSRFGGLKQMAPVDSEGHFLMDYSMYDALRAGFERVVCIIKPEMQRDFDQVVMKRLNGKVPVEFAYQTQDKLPEGFDIPAGRTKPWGTAHAVLCTMDKIDAPFCVINADDFYGHTAFEAIAGYLRAHRHPGDYAMVGYPIENTLTENGSVARGICATDDHGMLTSVVERTHIEKRPDGAAFKEAEGRFTFVPAGTFVSMNMWGFQPDLLKEIDSRFAPWLRENLARNPLKCEYFLPLIPDLLLREGKATVQVLPTREQWYGVTYADDLPGVKQALSDMRKKGIYPEKLWRNV